jgi:hypothetical protein
VKINPSIQQQTHANVNKAAPKLWCNISKIPALLLLLIHVSTNTSQEDYMPSANSINFLHIYRVSLVFRALQTKQNVWPKIGSKPVKGHMKEYDEWDSQTHNAPAIHTVWLLDSSSLSASEGISEDISKFCLAVILFHSFSTRKKTHWNRLSISKAVIAKTVR